jgi:hypothetical protein
MDFDSPFPAVHRDGLTAADAPGGSPGAHHGRDAVFTGDDAAMG